jgi:hypothetical protein
MKSASGGFRQRTTTSRSPTVARTAVTFPGGITSGAAARIELGGGDTGGAGGGLGGATTGRGGGGVGAGAGGGGGEGGAETVVPIVAVLFPEAGSDGDAAETDALLTNVPGAFALTTSFTVTEADFASCPRAQTTGRTPVHEPFVVLQEMGVAEFGRLSTTFTSFAALGPRFTTVNEYVTCLPTATGSGESDFVRTRSRGRPG